jgi:CelD/BcsL family acetyltransferase involved in cellulose biosynthesis
MKIDRLSLNGFATIRNEWNGLLKNSDSTSIFLTWEWIYIWWNVYGDDKKRSYILTARNTEGQLIGIAPCYLIQRKRFKYIPIKEIRFLGYGESVKPEYLDFITIPERRKDVITSFFDYFLDNGADWDVLNFTDLLESSQIIDSAKEMQQEEGIHLAQAKCACCPYSILPDSWETYIANLSKNARYNIRRKARKLEREFDVKFFRWSDISSIESAMHKLAELHTKRWKQKGLPHSFSDDKYNRFHQELAREFLKKDFLRLYVVEVEESIVAMLYCFKYEDKLLYYQSGYNPEFQQYSLGAVLFAYALEDAIAEGAREFDLLRGHHDYKNHWATEERNTIRLAVGNETLKGKVCLIDLFGKERIRNYLQETLPPKIYDSLKWIKGCFRPRDVKISQGHSSSLL